MWLLVFFICLSICFYRWCNRCSEWSRNVLSDTATEWWQWELKPLRLTPGPVLSITMLRVSYRLQDKIGTQMQLLLLLLLLRLFPPWHLVEGKDTVSLVICMLITICPHVKNLAQSELRGWDFSVCVSHPGQNTDLKINVNMCLQKAFQLGDCE